jgi:chlorobactene glucosyltransferase
MLFIYQLCITASLLVFFGILVKNLFDVRPLPKHPVFSIQPLVSVLVPARNEEKNIRACIESLAKQTYSNFELIVLDDKSEDATGKILAGLQTQYPKLKVIHGTTLPDGWLGKCFACHNLYKASTGELLLFTDADTIHAPNALSSSVQALNDTKADMLSIVAYQIMHTLGERLVIPMIPFLIMCFLPMKFIWTKRDEKYAFSNGQFMLFRRSMYERIGGHEAVRTAIVEDVWLCKAVKRAGGKVVVMNGTDEVRCRMYQGFDEVWNGFSKNLFAGLSYSVASVVAIDVFFVAVYLLPYCFLLVALVTQTFSIGLFWLPLVQIVLAIFTRALIAWRFKMPVLDSLCHAATIGLTIGISINSVRWIKSGKGSLWKGRRYDFSKVSG